MLNRSRYSTLALCVAALSQPAGAAGFQLFEHSASGLGRAYAGEAAALENTSVIFTNPAASTAFDAVAFSAGGVYVDPNVDIAGSSTYMDDVSDEDVAGSGVVPNLSVVVPFSPDWALGLSLGSNFSIGVEYDDAFAGSHFGEIAEIETADLNLSLAHQLTDTLSLGAGVSYIWGDGRVSSSIPDSLGNLPLPDSYAGLTMLDVEGENSVWTWNIGATWQVTQAHRVAASYKHYATLDLEGTASSDLELSYNGSGSLELELPAMAELASYHQINEKLAAHLGINWTGWSRFETLTAIIEGVPVEIKEENWHDTFRYSGGVSYQLLPKLLLRAGLAYDQSAIDDEYLTITIPDSDRVWYSLGAAYDINQTAKVDLGLSYIQMMDTDITETTTTDTLNVSATGDVWLVGLQYSQQF